MKNIFITTLAVLLAITGMNAAATNYNTNEQPFVFVESGIEFAVFKDGQFDFNVIRPNTAVGVRLNAGFLDFSFNTGHNYDTYLQYDEYGAVVQIENTSIYYDYYGRVKQIGNINLGYNYNGLVGYIGNMHVAYNPYGTILRVNGAINRYNVHYSNRAYCRSYSRPVARRVIVHNTPYRRNFVPVRVSYAKYRKSYKPNRQPVRVTRNFKRPGKVVLNNRNVVSKRKNTTRNVVNKRPNTQNNKVNNRVVKNTRKYTPRTGNTQKNNRVTTNSRNQNKQYNKRTVKTSNRKTVASNENKTYRRR